MALSPVRNGPGGVQRELLTSDRPVAAVQAAEASRPVRRDRFDRSAEHVDGERETLAKLRDRVKGIAEARERREAAERVAADGKGMLPKASMFVPLPDAWTPSGLNSEG